MAEKRILHLTLYRQPFEEIAAGKKRWEYRAITHYWVNRLLEQKFDEVHFRNGYGKDRPFMRVECLGVRLHRGHGRFEIKLGKILEVKNLV